MAEGEFAARSLEKKRTKWRKKDRKYQKKLKARMGRDKKDRSRKRLGRC